MGVPTQTFLAPIAAELLLSHHTHVKADRVGSKQDPYPKSSLLRRMNGRFSPIAHVVDELNYFGGVSHGLAPKGYWEGQSRGSCGTSPEVQWIH
jgi:hypothetical protein